MKITLSLFSKTTLSAYFFKTTIVVDSTILVLLVMLAHNSMMLFTTTSKRKTFFVCSFRIHVNSRKRIKFPGRYRSNNIPWLEPEFTSYTNRLYMTTSPTPTPMNRFPPIVLLAGTSTSSSSIGSRINCINNSTCRRTTTSLQIANTVTLMEDTSHEKDELLKLINNNGEHSTNVQLVEKYQQQQKQQSIAEENGSDGVDSNNNNSSMKNKKSLFEVTAKFAPAGDQPQAIQMLTEQLNSGNRFAILKGITGTGKTLVMSHIIANVNKPCLVLCHNKTLAAQLARELRSFLKTSAVEFFVSFYNTYVPESFQETTGRYVAKKSSINNEIDALRHRALRALLTRDDVVVVASVSCIYGLGSPNDYVGSTVDLNQNDIIKWSDLMEQLFNMKYEFATDDEEFNRGQLQVRVVKKHNNNNNDNTTNSTSTNQTTATTLVEGGEVEERTIVLWPPHEKFPMQLKLQSIDIVDGTTSSTSNNTNGNNNDGETTATVVQEEESNKGTSSSSMLSLSTTVTAPKTPTTKKKTTTPTKDEYFRIVSIREGRADGLNNIESVCIFPARYHVVPEERLENACTAIEIELDERLKELKADNKLVEADRLQKRVLNDVYMLRETGFCSGAENYSRHLAGREALSTPDTLLDYINIGRNGKQRDWLLIVDESHVALPQVSAMYYGDQARKRSLVKHGYRLPSALDNRPLHQDEFWDRIEQALFVSATPSHRELTLLSSSSNVHNTTNEQPVPVEMIIRPTYVCDPEIIVRSKNGQLQDLLSEIKKRTSVADEGSNNNKNNRCLVTTLTKRDAEDLSCFLLENNVKSTFIHSGLTTLERSNALKALQDGTIECLVGVNLLREGLDLPQVSLVAIFNADSEGFLRCETSLLQTIGRAARNTNGTAIFYANKITDSMKQCIDITNQRRLKQLLYNQQHGHIMTSTSGSSVLSIFDLLKDDVQAEQEIDYIMNSNNNNSNKKNTNTKQHKHDGTTSTSNNDSSNNSVISVSLSTKPGSNNERKEIDTDHIPNDPGVYIWKDANGTILYIGKAIRLRSRVKSYLSPTASHSRRIRIMIEKAVTVDFVVTPSERDALVLESNLIKHYQPPFNVLLKDDEHYPYICATIGDSIPRLTIVPHKYESNAFTTNNYQYYGPYTNYKEMNMILDSIEKKYSLRSLAFQVRHGSETKVQYNEIFHTMIQDVFTTTNNNNNNNDNTTSSSTNTTSEELVALRSQYEEAGLLFDSKYNKCRDVVAIGHPNNNNSSNKKKANNIRRTKNNKNSKNYKIENANNHDHNDGTFVVHLIQLRDGIVAGSFSYECYIPFFGTIQEEKDEDDNNNNNNNNYNSTTNRITNEDYADAIDTVLTARHYPAAPTQHCSTFNWFPDEILLPFPSNNVKQLQLNLRQTRHTIEEKKTRKSILISTASATSSAPPADAAATATGTDTTGKGDTVASLKKIESNIRAMEFAAQNAQQVANNKKKNNDSTSEGVASINDGTAAKELATLLSMDNIPNRIECYDISHTQGIFPVASRVVFVNGKPAPHLYRMFNINQVHNINHGNDDYASMTEVLERRFKRLYKVTKSKTPKTTEKTKVKNSKDIDDHQTIPTITTPIDPNNDSDNDDDHGDDDAWTCPDLIVIDGGKGQLNAALKGIELAATAATAAASSSSGRKTKKAVPSFIIPPICAIAKSKEEIYVPGKEYPINIEEEVVVVDNDDDNLKNGTTTINSSSPALLLLRALRDESHRFALKAHRRRRSIKKT